MKKVLYVIGQFFVRIGRWIKETAWIQPLLIVGGIFAIILSINPIYQAIKSYTDERNSAHEYYKKFQVSLKGVENSSADKLLAEIDENENNQSSSLDGKKFFLVFHQVDCAACEEAREGFEKLSSYSTSDLGGSAFSMKTIDASQDTDEDYKPSNSSAKSAFEAFLDRNIPYFEGYASAAQNTNYFLNGGISQETIDKIESAEVSQFQTPTIFLVDFTNNTPGGYKGVTGVFVGVPGNTSVEKASFLLDAWNYTGDFAAK